MAEYIKREDAEKALLERCKETGYGGLTPDDIRLVMRTLWRIPTADVVERKHGKWIHGIDEETGEQDLYAWTCSLCGEKYPWQPNYCPYCGARMDGDKDV